MDDGTCKSARDNVNEQIDTAIRDPAEEELLPDPMPPPQPQRMTPPETNAPDL